MELSAWSRLALSKAFLVPEWTIGGPADLLPSFEALEQLPLAAKLVISTVVTQMRGPMPLNDLVINCEVCMGALPKEPAFYCLAAYALCTMEDVTTGLEYLERAQELIGGPLKDVKLDGSLAAIRGFQEKQRQEDEQLNGLYDSGDYLHSAYVPPLPLASFDLPLPTAAVTEFQEEWAALEEQTVDGHSRYLRFMHIQSNVFEGVIAVDEEILSNLTRIGFYVGAVNHVVKVLDPPDVQHRGDLVKVLQDGEEILKRVDKLKTAPELLTGPWLEDLHRVCLRHARFTTEELECGDGATVKVRLAKRVGALRKVACWTTLLDDPNAVVQFAPVKRVMADLSSALKLAIGRTAILWHLAAYIHHLFINVHPFSDGNGRLARYLASAVLIKHKLPPIVVTEQLRQVYFSALNVARANRNLAPLVSVFQQGARLAFNYIRDLPPPTQDELSQYRNDGKGGKGRRRVFMGRQSL